MLSIQTLLLILSTILGGIIGIKIPNLDKNKFKIILTFTGGYLLSIVIIHILPEAFNASEAFISLYILAGFFMQLVLELSTKGLEHGHIHGNGIDGKLNFISLFIALFIHSLFDGSILASPHNGCNHVSNMPLLLGVIMHKVPVSFTLTVMMLSLKYSRKTILWVILIFSISSPIGMVIVDYLYNKSILSSVSLKYIMGFISGSFLHISTTIFFEHSSDHNFNKAKLVASVSGAILAILTQYII